MKNKASKRNQDAFPIRRNDIGLFAAAVIASVLALVTLILNVGR